MIQTISPKQLAKAVGVSESSMKRWVDEGLIQVNRTRGGHRRIPIAEAARFIRASRYDLANPAALGIAELSAAPRVSETDEAADALYDALLAGQVDQARSLTLNLYLSGQPVSRLFDNIIAPAMHRMGELFRHDADGIFIEHRATDLCIGAINQLRALVPSPLTDEYETPTAIGGALADDLYILPSLMAVTVFADEGFNAINLGPQTPADVLLAASQRYDAQLVWLCCSTTSDPAKMVRTLGDIAGQLNKQGRRLVVGGRAIKELTTPLSHSMIHVQSMSELAAFANGAKAAVHPV